MPIKINVKSLEFKKILLYDLWHNFEVAKVFNQFCDFSS